MTALSPASQSGETGSRQTRWSENASGSAKAAGGVSVNHDG